MLEAGLAGFAVSFSLIVAIGAQNSLVLRQGLSRSHVFISCLFCGLSDAVLIALGVFGAGHIATRFPLFETVLIWAGALFLIAYAGIRLRAAYLGEYQAEIDAQARPVWRVIVVLAAVTWLNPHVYLDTLALIGAVSLKFEGHKLAFAIGAASASVLFFFMLGYGARFLAPIFKSERAWRILDIGIAAIMLTIAATLILS